MPALDHLSTYGDTREAALESTREAIAAAKDGIPLPRGGPEPSIVELCGVTALTRLPRISGRTMVKALHNAGFEVTHVRGSHHYLRLPGSVRLVVVPVHGNRDLPTGTLRAIWCGKASVARTLEGDEHAVHTTRPNTSLDLDCGDGLELPPVTGMVVKDLLKLVTGHLASEQALAELNHLVLVTGRHVAS